MTSGYITYPGFKPGDKVVALVFHPPEIRSGTKATELARVLNEKGHPPKIQQGMIVKIVKVFPQTLVYDLKLENGKYHRWLADFEIIPSSLV